MPDESPASAGIIAPQAACAQGERRRRNRVETQVPARFLPFDPRYLELAEVATVNNFSREGLYFITELKHYEIGMRIHVTLPYGQERAACREYLGIVIRLDELEDGRRGMALRFVF